MALLIDDVRTRLTLKEALRQAAEWKKWRKEMEHDRKLEDMARSRIGGLERLMATKYKKEN